VQFNELKTAEQVGDFISGISMELSDNEKDLLYYVENNSLSMTSREQLISTIFSCKYAVENNIPGDFVECGVWRGGHAILAAGIFKLYNSDKKIWLFDTFEGFIDANISPSVYDVINKDNMRVTTESYYNIKHCGNSIEKVAENFVKYNLLSDNIYFIKGDVLQTLTYNNVPTKISVLRLDTDWYDSTLKELETLYPVLSTGGVLIVDDYGIYSGLRKAVDDYFSNKKKPLLQYIDNQGRLGIKV